MVFKDDENNQGLISDIDFLIWGKGDKFHDQYSLEDRTRNINIMYGEAVTHILKANPDWMWDDNNRDKSPIAKTKLRNGQDNYSFPDTIVTINRVRVKNKDDKFQTLEPVARRELSDDELDETGTPEKYYKINGSVFLVPTPDYTKDNGLEVQIQREPSYFDVDDTDKEPGFLEFFHRYLSVGAALRYASSSSMHDKAQEIRAEKELLIEDLKNHYEGRADDETPGLRLKEKNIRHYGLT
ncbi:MAG: hypothetical protein ACOC40_02255 [Thermoplasmatota archaeon]